MLCDTCHRAVKRVFELIEKSIADREALRYDAAAELDTTCEICRKLFENSGNHLIYREIVFTPGPPQTRWLWLKVKSWQCDQNSTRQEEAENYGEIRLVIQSWDNTIHSQMVLSGAARPDMLTVPEFTGDAQCLSLASKWIEICQREHYMCNKRQLRGYRPPRLLRLYGDSIYLVSGSDLPLSIPIPYATLSYCVSCLHAIIGNNATD